MNLRIIPIGQLQPAPYNPRIPLEPGSDGFRRLERSLQEFDLVQPIVWNERTGHVVGGHQRLEVLKHHGTSEVACVVVDLPLEREMALNVTLNNAQVGSDWDTQKLVHLLSELDELPDADATLTGFDEDDLQDLLFTPDPEFDAGADDEPTDNVIRVTLEIPVNGWEAIRPDVDALIARHDLTSHVQRPMK